MYVHVGNLDLNEYDHDTRETLAGAVDTWTERASVGTLLLLVGFLISILACLALRSAWAATTGAPVLLLGLSLVHHSERRVRAILRTVQRGVVQPDDLNLTAWFSGT